MNTEQTAKQLRLIADILEKHADWPEAKSELTPELQAKGYEQYGFGPGITVVEKPDPYAALKKAHAEGKVIQCITLEGDWVDCTIQNPPRWNVPVESYRTKPEAPTFQLPPPPPGMQWHRTDGWQEGDLPEGWRPMMVDEKYLKGDEWKMFDGWQVCKEDQTIKVWPRAAHSRTRRPLTFTHAGKTWTWHKPGDPMPCDGDRNVYCLVTKGDNRETGCTKGRYMAWSVTDETHHFWGVIIGWRYADEKKTVPLGPEDVPPGSVLKATSWQSYEWRLIDHVYSDGVLLSNCSRTHLWECLKEHYQINRSIPLTGKWNPDAWEPCHKTISKNGK